MLALQTMLQGAIGINFGLGLIHGALPGGDVGPQCYAFNPLRAFQDFFNVCGLYHFHQAIAGLLVRSQRLGFL